MAHVTCRMLIDGMLRRTERKTFHENEWGKRHVAAWRPSDGAGHPICKLIDSAAQIADRHWVQYGARIGDDGVLGPAWLKIIKSARTLLNGEIGAFDAGTLDGLLIEMATTQGFSESDL